MNYLAHAYLSDESAESRLGNILGDSVKGLLTSHEGCYSYDILQGIKAHRAIDSFTDQHPLYITSKQRISSGYRRFAGIIVDVCYDYFLSKHWSTFSDQPFDDFVAEIYALLVEHQPILPSRFREALPYMISQDWLGSNKTVEGVGLTFGRVARRFKRSNNLASAHIELECNYAGLESDFLEFFPQLIQFAQSIR